MVVELDIWGPLSEHDAAWFEPLLQEAGSEVRYRGFLQPAEIYSVLPDYDALAFPTYYSGEGFPGVVVDAFVAGIPVIASDWQDNEEFVRDGHTGLIFKSQEVADLTEKIRFAIANPEWISVMKRNAAERAVAYHVDTIIPPLLKRMGLAE